MQPQMIGWVVTCYLGLTDWAIGASHLPHSVCVLDSFIYPVRLEARYFTRLQTDRGPDTGVKKTNVGEMERARSGEEQGLFPEARNMTDVVDYEY